MGEGYRKSSHTTFRIELQIEFPQLKKRYWGQHLWARGYFAVSTGNVTSDMVKESVKHHFENTEPVADPFRIEQP